jgi:hypothetical protein
MSRAKARFTQTDVRRILSAAAKAGVSVRVEIAADGKIVVVTGSPRDEQNATNPWDGVLEGAEEQKRAS